MSHNEYTGEPVAKKQEKEHGAIIVEAIVSLTVFMFAMFTLLSVIQIAYTQARMSVALSCATKQIAQYAHILYATGLNETMSGEGGKSSELFGQVGEFLETLGADLGSISSELGQYTTEAGEAMSATSISGMLKSASGQGLAMQLMKQNLVGSVGDTPEAFIARNHIQDIDMNQSKILEGAEDKSLYMCCDYDIQVVKLLDIEYTFHMQSWAYTTAWG